MSYISEYVYEVLYKNDHSRYKRVELSDGELSFGILNWSGYDAIKILSEISSKLGFIRSLIILGYKLRQKIVYPYDKRCVGIGYEQSLTQSEADKISKLINTKVGMMIQDKYVYTELDKRTTYLTGCGITDLSLITFMTAMAVHWTDVSAELLAICKVRALRNNITTLDELRPELVRVVSGNNHTHVRIRELIDIINHGVSDITKHLIFLQGMAEAMVDMYKDKK